MNERIPGGCSTYSKTLFLGQEGYPQCVSYGQDALLWDTAGHHWVDWWSSLGAISLGYSYPTVSTAIRRQLDYGLCFSLPHRLEGETAELLCGLAGTEQLRWAKNGSDATEAAVRLARYVTGRDWIVTTGYHGFHSDLVTATPGKSGGVTTDRHGNAIGCNFVIPASEGRMSLYPDWQAAIAAVQNHGAAALIAEPLFADGTIWPWAEIKDACHKAGALLIFDEVITGFRYRPGSASWTVTPDLYCFGKAIANGMPLACVAGPRELMREYEKNVFFSSTAAAECLSLAACKATLETMRDEPVHEHIWKIGQQIIEAIREITLFKHDEKMTFTGLPPRTQLQFPDDCTRDRFLSGMAHRGHLLGRDNFITYSHTAEQVADFAVKAAEVLDDLSSV